MSSSKASDESMRKLFRSPKGLRHIPTTVAQGFGPAILALAIVGAQGFSPAVFAQPPAPAEQVSFQDAVRRAIEKKPSAAAAAAGILPAQGPPPQARAATRLQVNRKGATTTLTTRGKI